MNTVGKNRNSSLDSPFMKVAATLSSLVRLGLKLKQFTYGGTYFHIGAVGMRINGRSQVPKRKIAKQIVLHAGFLLLPAVSLQRSWGPQLSSLLFSLVFPHKDFSWIGSRILFRAPMFCQFRSAIKRTDLTIWNIEVTKAQGVSVTCGSNPFFQVLYLFSHSRNSTPELTTS